MQDGRVSANDAQPGHAVLNGDLDVLELHTQQLVHLTGHRDHEDLAAHARLTSITLARQWPSDDEPRITRRQVIPSSRRDDHPVVGDDAEGGGNLAKMSAWACEVSIPTGRQRTSATSPSRGRSNDG